MDAIRVERNVPVPPTLKRRYPWKQLKVGDSFVVPGNIDRSILYGGARNAGIKVLVRKVGDQLRVWRTK